MTGDFLYFEFFLEERIRSVKAQKQQLEASYIKRMKDLEYDIIRLEKKLFDVKNQQGESK